MKNEIKLKSKEWNPISSLYSVPLAHKIAYKLKNSVITPNQITMVNTIFSVIIPPILLFVYTPVNLILFGLCVRLWSFIDVLDGSLAKIKNQVTPFGGWFDGCSDKFVTHIWYILIAIVLYLNTNKIFYLFVGFLFIFGSYMYTSIALTSVIHFRKGNTCAKTNTNINKNIIVKIISFVFNVDVQYHVLTLCAFFFKLNWFLIFYGVLFNIMWIGYFLFYSFIYLTKKNVIGA